MELLEGIAELLAEAIVGLIQFVGEVIFYNWDDIEREVKRRKQRTQR